MTEPEPPQNPPPAEEPAAEPPSVDPDPGAADDGEARGTAAAGLPLPPLDQSLEARVVPYWGLGALGTVTLVSVFAGPAILGVLRRGIDASSPLALGVSGLAVFFLVPALIRLLFAPSRYRRFRFGVSRRLLYVKQGVLARHEKIVPVSKVQHVDVDQAPLERAFRLSTLEVFTAGGRRATFRIPGLSPERADELRRRILEASDALDADARDEDAARHDDAARDDDTDGHDDAARHDDTHGDDEAAGRDHPADRPNGAHRELPPGRDEEEPPR